MTWTNASYDSVSGTAAIFWEQNTPDSFVYSAGLAQGDDAALTAFLADAETALQAHLTEVAAAQVAATQNAAMVAAILEKAQK